MDVLSIIWRVDMREATPVPATARLGSRLDLGLKLVTQAPDEAGGPRAAKGWDPQTLGNPWPRAESRWRGGWGEHVERHDCAV